MSLEEYKRLQNLVFTIQSTVDDIVRKKEFWFNKKEEMKKEINALIKQVRDIKSEKDKKNIELQNLKKERDKYNNQVKILIKAIKSINKEKSRSFNDFRMKLDPEKILQKIDELEHKVEVETSFEKEKKLMEEIKRLKKTYNDNSEVSKIAEKAHKLSKEIAEAKNKADEFHRKIQELTKDADYETFLDLSKKITNLKKEQEEAFKRFIEHKNLYLLHINELKQKLGALNNIKKTIIKKKELVKILKDEEEKKVIEEKSKLIEEKLKTKKKITTDDLLGIQKSEEKR